MKKSKKLVTIISFVLAFITAFYFTGCSYTASEQKIRTVTLQEYNIDYQAILDEFEDAKFDVNGYVGEFTGYRTFDHALFELIDNVSLDEVSEVEPFKTKFNVTYDAQSNIVTLYAEIADESGAILIDTIYGLAFQNVNGDLDAYLDIDGETVLLSELAESGMIANAGWLKNLIKTTVVVVAIAVVAVVAPVVVAVVAVTAVAVVATTAEIVSGIVNYNHNKKLTQPTTYINDQSSNSRWEDWKFGWNTMDSNGCGLMAIYNVMRFRGNTQNLADIIYYHEVTGGQLMFGLFGTDPTHLPQYLSSKGVESKQYTSLSSLEVAAKNMSDSQQIILTYWNQAGTVTQGAHTIALSKSGAEFTSYNCSRAKTATTLSPFIAHGSFFIGYVIG